MSSKLYLQTLLQALNKNNVFPKIQNKSDYVLINLDDLGGHGSFITLDKDHITYFPAYSMEHYTVEASIETAEFLPYELKSLGLI